MDMTTETTARMLELSNIWMKEVKKSENSPVLPLDWLNQTGFFEAPASSKYHGDYPGGLYEHSLFVYRRLNSITKNMNLKWERPESPFIIGVFHDICKCDQYRMIDDPNGYHYEHANNLLLSGHGAKSVMLLSTQMQLTEEEMLCIRYHMGAYEKDDWAGYDAAIRKYPNTLWTHTADMLASKVDGV